jgi:hypothetical protein
MVLFCVSKVFIAEEAYGVADDVPGDTVKVAVHILEDILNISKKSAPFSDEAFFW